MKVATLNTKTTLKRSSEFFKANRIRLDLFSFAKNEINEHKKDSNCFSFSNKIEVPNEILEKEIRREETKLITKQISISSQKTLNDTFSDIDDSEEDSSDMSCEEEDL